MQRAGRAVWLAERTGGGLPDGTGIDHWRPSSLGDGWIAAEQPHPCAQTQPRPDNAETATLPACPASISVLQREASRDRAGCMRALARHRIGQLGQPVGSGSA